jgi:hypothetical protein
MPVPQARHRTTENPPWCGAVRTAPHHGQDVPVAELAAEPVHVIDRVIETRD